MFKFKMLFKVLVAVIVLGQVIESNLKLCIALSIDLDAAPSSGQQSRDEGRREAGATSSQLAASSQKPVQQEGVWSPLLAAGHLAAGSSSSSSSNATNTGTELEPAHQNISQILESNGRLNYFGKILVGEQQLPFMVLFDLTSTGFWLASSECKSFQCVSRQKYNRTESATHQADGRLASWTYDGQLGAARVSSRLARDRITFAGVTLENVTFGEALEMEGDSFARLPVDGFLGLGFKSLVEGRDGDSMAAQMDIESPLERLLRAGLLREPIFSLLISGDVKEWSYSANNGALKLGELAPGYEARELAYVPVTRAADYWEFQLTSISLRQACGSMVIQQACESACPAILATGATFIGGHFTDVDRLNRALGAYPIGNGLCRLAQCDLSLMPAMVFDIGGAEFALEPEDYVALDRIRGHIVSCYSALRVLPAEQYPFWILGERFLKRHYVVFDQGQKRLGFAPAKRPSGRPNGSGGSSWTNEEEEDEAAAIEVGAAKDF